MRHYQHGIDQLHIFINNIVCTTQAMAKSLTFTEAVDRVQEWRRRWEHHEERETAEEDDGESGRVAVTRL